MEKMDADWLPAAIIAAIAVGAAVMLIGNFFDFLGRVF